jgi:hypothetical protein
MRWIQLQPRWIRTGIYLFALNAILYFSAFFIAKITGNFSILESPTGPLFIPNILMFEVINEVLNIRGANQFLEFIIASIGYFTLGALLGGLLSKIKRE